MEEYGKIARPFEEEMQMESSYLPLHLQDQDQYQTLLTGEGLWIGEAEQNLLEY